MVYDPIRDLEVPTPSPHSPHPLPLPHLTPSPHPATLPLSRPTSRDGRLPLPPAFSDPPHHLSPSAGSPLGALLNPTSPRSVSMRRSESGSGSGSRGATYIPHLQHQNTHPSPPTAGGSHSPIPNPPSRQGSFSLSMLLNDNPPQTPSRSPTRPAPTQSYQTPLPHPSREGPRPGSSGGYFGLPQSNWQPEATPGGSMPPPPTSHRASSDQPERRDPERRERQSSIQGWQPMNGWEGPSPGSGPRAAGEGGLEFGATLGGSPAGFGRSEEQGRRSPALGGMGGRRSPALGAVGGRLMGFDGGGRRSESPGRQRRTQQGREVSPMTVESSHHPLPPPPQQQHTPTPISIVIPMPPIPSTPAAAPSRKKSRAPSFTTPSATFHRQPSFSASPLVATPGGTIPGAGAVKADEEGMKVWERVKAGKLGGGGRKGSAVVGEGVGGKGKGKAGEKQEKEKEADGGRAVKRRKRSGGESEARAAVGGGGGGMPMEVDLTSPVLGTTPFGERRESGGSLVMGKEKEKEIEGEMREKRQPSTSAIAIVEPPAPQPESESRRSSAVSVSAGDGRKRSLAESEGGEEGKQRKKRKSTTGEVEGEVEPVQGESPAGVEVKTPPEAVVEEARERMGKGEGEGERREEMEGFEGVVVSPKSRDRPLEYSPAPAMEQEITPPRTMYNPKERGSKDLYRPLSADEIAWFRDPRNRRNPFRPDEAVAVAVASSSRGEGGKRRREEEEDVGEGKRRRAEEGNGYAEGSGNGNGYGNGYGREPEKDGRGEYSNSSVAAHYNNRQDKGLAARSSSAILGLRNFNNWAKSILIRKFAQSRPGEDRGRDGDRGGDRGARGGRVLDMGCGKGGDLKKWEKAGVGLYIGIDIASGSISDAQSRYRSAPPRPYFPAEFHTLDCYTASISTVLTSTVLDPLFDTVSMQFCIHYAFESASKTRMMLENVSRWLRVGGRFVGTTLSDMKIRHFLDLIPPHAPLTIQNDYFRMDFSERSHKGPFGHAYNFTLTDAIDDCMEWVVDWENFVGLAKEYNLRLIYRQDFDELFQHEKDVRESRELAMTMRVLNRRGDLGMTEGEYEAAAMYMGFAFEKI